MKRFALLLLAVLIAVVPLFSAAAESSYILGDADADGTVSIFDATAIQRVLAQFVVQPFDRRAADITGDGLDIFDATRIQRYLVKIDDHFGIGETIYPDQPTEIQPDTQPDTQPATQPATQKPTDNYELPFVPA